jgi:hypothetical protein
MEMASGPYSLQILPQNCIEHESNRGFLGHRAAVVQLVGQTGFGWSDYELAEVDFRCSFLCYLYFIGLSFFWGTR